MVSIGATNVAILRAFKHIEMWAFNESSRSWWYYLLPSWLTSFTSFVHFFFRSFFIRLFSKTEKNTPSSLLKYDTPERPKRRKQARNVNWHQAIFVGEWRVCECVYFRIIIISELYTTTLASVRCFKLMQLSNRLIQISSDTACECIYRNNSSSEFVDEKLSIQFYDTSIDTMTRMMVDGNELVHNWTRFCFAHSSILAVFAWTNDGITKIRIEHLRRNIERFFFFRYFSFFKVRSIGITEKCHWIRT